MRVGHLQPSGGNKVHMGHWAWSCPQTHKTCRRGDRTQRAAATEGLGGQWPAAQVFQDALGQGEDPTSWLLCVFSGRGAGGGDQPTPLRFTWCVEANSLLTESSWHLPLLAAERPCTLDTPLRAAVAPAMNHPVLTGMAGVQDFQTEGGSPGAERPGAWQGGVCVQPAPSLLGRSITQGGSRQSSSQHRGKRQATRWRSCISCHGWAHVGAVQGVQGSLVFLELLLIYQQDKPEDI